MYSLYVSHLTFPIALSSSNRQPAPTASKTKTRLTLHEFPARPFLLLLLARVIFDNSHLLARLVIRLNRFVGFGLGFLQSDKTSELSLRFEVGRTALEVDTAIENAHDVVGRRKEELDMVRDYDLGVSSEDLVDEQADDCASFQKRAI